MDYPIIDSLIDTDLYKLTMQQFALELYPNLQVTYKFYNRSSNTFFHDKNGNAFNASFVKDLKKQINFMSQINLSEKEYEYLKQIPFFKPWYLEYLKNYRFDPNEVHVDLDNNNQLSIDISGPWHSAILWEVPLMAVICELFFDPSNRNNKTLSAIKKYYDGTLEKYNKLNDYGVKFADFGTRRRDSKRIQETAICALKDGQDASSISSFVGTSNVHFAMKHNLKPIGTMAHELFQVISAVSSLRFANRSALYKWQKVYEGNLGIALTDTYGTNSFFRDFDMFLSKLYDGVRHDSGDPFVFCENVIKHYEKHKIDPRSKTIIFSDSLNVEKAIEINREFGSRINVAFGIGTHITNDKDLFDGEIINPLNIVIKIHSAGGIPVVKLSDDTGKTVGDKNAVRVAQWTHFQRPLG